MMIQFPISHRTNNAIVNSMVPKYWSWKDLLTDDPARLEARVFFCEAANSKVSCHAPICCNQECSAYGAKRIR